MSIDPINIAVEAAANAVSRLIPGDSKDSLVEEYAKEETQGRIARPKTEKEKGREARMKALLIALIKENIDPMVYDRLMSFEQDRYLKRRFGYSFLVLTFLFTAASYAIVILNSTQQWGINETAILALVIETPIQFIGLLYIIARNLFPTNEQVLADTGKELVQTKPPIPKRFRRSIS